MAKTAKQKKVFKEVSLCELPIVAERKLAPDIESNRLSLIRYHEKKWVNETTLRYHFLDDPISWKGGNEQKEAVREAFNTWKKLGIGLSFIEVGNPRLAEIRIGFERGGSWSYVGRDCIDLVPEEEKSTMNFGWSLTTPYGRDTALHEIGHALGFPHEHQNPHAGIEWNTKAVYEYFEGPPNNWPHRKTNYNILRKISSDAVAGSQWDVDSIMHYSFKAGLIVNPEKYKTQDLIPESGLSAADKKEVIKFYPKPKKEEEITKLLPFESEVVQLNPTEQIDFLIKPPETRDYTIGSFGTWDTVMVLFESYNGNLQYVDGDDDSGTDFNSKISVRLLQGREYFLRLRLYYTVRSGKGAVMMW